MGYACPVCEAPQADGEHLANHLAFTAMLGRTDHEAWLDEHAPGWGEMDPAELAAVAVEAVPETEFPQVFEDTTGRGSDAGHHDHDDSRRADEPTLEDHLASGQGRRGYGTGGRGDLTGERAAILEKAHELTRAMLEDEDTARTGDDEADEDTARTGDGNENA